MHWAVAVPFIVCWTTALILVVFYNPDPGRPFRDVVSWAHRIGPASLSRRIKLPWQDKFNAGEKINFAILSSTYPVYLCTGLLIWFGPSPSFRGSSTSRSRRSRLR